MSKFMITEEPAKKSSAHSKSIGTQPKRAVCFCPQIGMNRYYLSTFSNPSVGLEVSSFTSKDEAESVCNDINLEHKAFFKVETFAEAPNKYI